MSSSSSTTTAIGPAQAEDAASLLLSSRETGSLVSDPGRLPALSSIDDVYQVHDAMLSIKSTLGDVVGWKCGACGPAPQKAMGLTESFRAPLFAKSIAKSPGRVDKKATGAIMCEAEMAFIMAKPLGPKTDDPLSTEPYTAEEVWDAVGYICPAIEVCGTRWTGEALGAANTWHKLADDGLNVMCVLGPAVETQHLAPGGRLPKQAADLPKVGVRMLLNGKEVATGSGANVLGSPLDSLTWLANNMAANRPDHQSGRGSGTRPGVSSMSGQWGGKGTAGLLPGDVVMSGAAAVVKGGQFGPGDLLRVEFEGGLGSTEVAFDEEAGGSSRL